MAVACLILTQPLSGVQASTPTFLPVGGTYPNTQSVVISCALPVTASIYYTTNGTTPTFPITGSTQLYTGAVSVSAPETLRAIAVQTGYTQSGIIGLGIRIQSGDSDVPQWLGHTAQVNR